MQINCVTGGPLLQNCTNLTGTLYRTTDQMMAGLQESKEDQLCNRQHVFSCRISQIRMPSPPVGFLWFWGQRVCRPAALQIWLLIQSRNKFAKSENQQMASEKHKWSLKVTYPELSSPTLIKVRMRSPHPNYIYRKRCKDGCFDPIEDMMVAASFFICRAGNYRGLFTLSLILPADESQAQTNKFSSYYIYYYVITPNRP